MPFAMSPSVIVVEKDYTDIVPAVSSSVGATVGVFKWGPVLDPLLIDSETTLINRFGTPNDENFQYFFTAANFLTYTDSLYVTRAATLNQRNAISMPTGTLALNGAITGGSGYLVATPPTITIGAPQISGNAATAVPVISGIVSSITVGAGGTGYIQPPNIAIAAPPTGGIAQVNITSGGTGCVTPTVAFTGGGGTGAAATLGVTNGVITSVTITNPGSGYTSAPTATITYTGGGSGASLTPVVAGSISSITITSGGSGCVSPTVAFSGGGGTGAAATLTVTGGVITGYTITNPGSGYTSAPTATITYTGGGSGASLTPVVAGGITATAVANITNGVVTSITVTNRGKGYISAPAVTVTAVEGGSGATATAVVTNILYDITLINTSGIYSEPPGVTITGTGSGAFIPLKVVPNNSLVINNHQDYLDQYSNGAANVGTWAAKYPGILGNSITVSMVDSSLYVSWDWKDEFDGPPGTSTYCTNHNAPGCKDELHIIVLDKEGKWTGVKNGILEKFAYVSKASDAKRSDGTISYYKDVINNGSKYIWWMDHPTTIASATSVAWGTDTININTHTPTFTNLSLVDSTEYLSGGVDDFEPDEGDIMDAFSIYNDAEEYDISLIPVGPSPISVAQYVIQNIAEVRKDCVAFISPLNINTGEPIIGNTSENFEAIVNYRGSPDDSGNIVGLNVSSSYGVLDSGYKYQYDRYNDKYRWVPLNGDIAGLCARTDWTNDPWWSPGGYNRGQIKGVVKLAVNPRKAFRDLLYKNGINPVVTFPGQGTVLFGDKTLLAKPSAFDRINVRRLFIVLEKAIATASKYQLFEFNDDFTRRKFVSMVEPFLRDVKGRRGLIDFLVKCDTQNNTPEVIDRNEFIADIYLKPARSINFIYLNFIATRTGVDFEEVGA